MSDLHEQGEKRRSEDRAKFTWLCEVERKGMYMFSKMIMPKLAVPSENPDRGKAQ